MLEILSKIRNIKQIGGCISGHIWSYDCCILWPWYYNFLLKIFVSILIN